MANVNTPSSDRHQVVVIGSGFGGLFGTKALKNADVDVTMVAKTTHHLFQPLLYQVATGILSEGEIAPPTREVLAGQKNARVILGEVTDIDLAARTVTSKVLNRVTVTPYDSLLVAAGAGQSYFGNDQFAEFAPGMKSIDDALELRGRIFGAFELAEISDSEEEIERLLTFVVVGAGPTGVEMAGQIAELAHRTLRRDFRRINTREAGSSCSTRRRRCCRRSAPSSARRPRSRWRSSASRSSSARWSSTSTSGASTSRTRTAPAAASRRPPRCGPPACRPARWAGCSASRPARRSTGPAGSA